MELSILNVYVGIRKSFAKLGDDSLENEGDKQRKKVIIYRYHHFYRFLRAKLENILKTAVPITYQ